MEGRKSGREFRTPAPGRSKYNIDASFSSSLNKVGLRMCLRDNTGDFVLAQTDWFAPLCDVDAGEAVRLYTTLEWVSDIQFDYVEFALDSKRDFDQVNSTIDDNSEFWLYHICM
ncbi:hypothetical protein MTR_8g031800 [Medicago truncatula]|uniref:RNase H type-1 domain-containing protein n=1 Tax=Medicago truncatula TaxID=3880 RepID=G7LBS2_MEDTR|nr:hypothetical protein MTR_8g031800 [Medicago truncatula]